jgi:hypothetical protein
MKHVFFPLWSLAAAAMLLLPGGAAAQDTMPAKSPATLVCKDGSKSTQPANQACASHGGVDSAATQAAMPARGGAGQTPPPLVICGDGSSALAGTTACRSHGGVDTPATRAATNQRFHGQDAKGQPPSPESSQSDSVRARPPGPHTVPGDSTPKPESP